MRIVATLDDSNPDVIVTIDKTDGSQAQKTVPFEDFVDVLKKEEESRPKKIVRFGTFPKGFIDGGTNGKELECLIHIPGGLRPLEYYGTTYIVPFPDVVFYLFSQNGKVTKSRIFCVRETPTKGTKLFHYPFGNVYQDGDICWGSNVIPKVNMFSDFDKVTSLFFNADTNDDLYHSFEMRRGRKKVALLQRELLETLKEMKEFPVKYLKDTGKTFGQL